MIITRLRTFHSSAIAGTDRLVLMHVTSGGTVHEHVVLYTSESAGVSPIVTFWPGGMLTSP